MLRESMIAAILFALFVRCAFAADVDDLIAKLENQEAIKAIQSYEDVVASFQEDFTMRTAAAKKKLLADLETAQTSATKANQLDEAVLIRDVKRAYKAASEPAPLMTDIIVIAAFYGQNISWLDVTDKVREAINGKSRWSTTVETKDWGEPAPGFGGPRTLMIRYSVDGKDMFKATYQGKVVTIP